jgi:hypothetical protein
MQCAKCKKGIFPEMEAYIISAVIMKEKDDYERTTDVACLCDDCYNER